VNCFIAIWFVPSETVKHPETLAPVFEENKAYSIKAFEAKCAETGIDYVNGQLMTLDCARFMRDTKDITSFVMLKSEE
jgi:hypothetical protein